MHKGANVTKTIPKHKANRITTEVPHWNLHYARVICIHGPYGKRE